MYIRPNVNRFRNTCCGQHQAPTFSQYVVIKTPYVFEDVTSFTKTYINLIIIISVEKCLVSPSVSTYFQNLMAAMFAEKETLQTTNYTLFIYYRYDILYYRKTDNLGNVFHLACIFVSSGSEFLLKSGHGIWIFYSWFYLWSY